MGSVHGAALDFAAAAQAYRLARRCAAEFLQLGAVTVDALVVPRRGRLRRPGAGLLAGRRGHLPAVADRDRARRRHRRRPARVPLRRRRGPVPDHRLAPHGPPPVGAGHPLHLRRQEVSAQIRWKRHRSSGRCESPTPEQDTAARKRLTRIRSGADGGIIPPEHIPTAQSTGAMPYPV